MKVLILSCNNGGGHNSVATAVKETYTSHGNTADIVDFMAFLPRGWSKFASNAHSFLYRYQPKLFDYGYQQAETHRNQFKKGHSTRSLLDLGTMKLRRYIKKNQYDCVICTHVFASLMLTDAIKKHKLSVATGVVETDYTISPGAEKSELDWHFVPSAKQKEQLAEMGVPKDRITVTGIPTRAQFFNTLPKKKARKKLGIDENKKNIVVCCGSMGCGPLDGLMEKLTELVKNDDSIAVSMLCASNKKLYKRMSERYGAQKNVYVFGKQSNMSLMLDSADAYVTKPGGISTTEAAQKSVPMVLINVVGGCETYNMDFFLSSGGAVTSDSVEGLAEKAVEICRNEEIHRRMEQALKTVFEENDKELIYSHMTSCVKKTNTK